MLRKMLYIFIIMALVLGIPSSALAQDEVPPFVPATDVSGLAIADDVQVELSPELTAASGEVQVVVSLRDDPLVLAVGKSAKTKGPKLSVKQQKAYVRSMAAKQSAVADQIKALGGQQIGQVKFVLNAVIFSVDASKLTEIAKLPNVSTIRPVVDYELDLSETVPYIGASYAQNTLGFTGKGVNVAVLDSGIDYIHYNLGGSGSLAEYNANDPTIIEPGTFPTAKVVGGYDFVGGTWPDTELLPDPDPLDAGTGAGHGTHVADIIGGKSTDGLHKGVAPDANLFAVKVCSSVSTSCSGVALLQGMDYAMDPNGDGSIADAVDVINMSLGSSYGQREDDLSEASANAARMGVLVVVSAGNSSDRPFIVGSPSSTPEVISVAQTQVPSAYLYVITAGGVSVGGSWQPWSGAPAYASGALQYGNGAGGNLNGCASFPAGTLTGKIVLIDRGVCAISIKVSNAADGGALAAVIANNAAQAPGDLPPDFSYGGGNPSIPAYTITRTDGLLLRTVAGQNAVIDPASAASLKMNMVSSSSRGPSFSYSAIKPDIGAPGASLSAEYGTGNGQTAFGGTSGAAPMVSGAAALMVQAYPMRDPIEIKALLMNTGETNIGINPVGLPGYMAPITRIGGGEVRVDKALMTTTSAWDTNDETGSLSFGYQPISKPGTTMFQKSVTVRNYSKTMRTYTITPTFRYADDEASGAIKFLGPKQVKVPANGMKSFVLNMAVDSSKLPTWALNGGALGGDGYRLQSVEFDGYINIADSKDNVHLAWQILPHKSAAVSTTTKAVRLVKGSGKTQLINPNGAIDGRVDVFALLGTSPQIPAAELPQPGDNYAVIDMKSVGARLVQTGATSYGIQIAINTFGQRAHPAYPAEFDVYIDVNADGVDDYLLYTAENGGFAVSGQTLVNVYNLSTGTGGAYYYADADLESGNMIMTAPLAAIGATPGTKLHISVYAFDNYFTGALTDAIEGIVFTPGLPKYTTDSDTLVVPMKSFTRLAISAVAGGSEASPSQTGLLFMYRDALADRETDTLLVVE